MSRVRGAVVVALVIAVVGMGGVLIARGRGGAAGPAGLVVYAPCGMNSPITSATHLFRQAHPEIQLDIVYDNSIVLVRKIRGGARPDVFISPGELEMRQLAEEGFVDTDTVRDFASLDLVLIAPRRVEGLNSLEDLKRAQIETISLADPEHNSIGYYAEAALRHLGLWEPLQSKLFLREYPLEAVTLVTSGSVDAGITYLTCPLDTAPEKADKSEVRIVAKIPRDSHPRVRLQAGLLRDSPNRRLGQEFVDFLTSEQAQQTLAATGLLPIEEAM